MKRTAFFIFSCFLFHAVHAGNLRQISSRDGLSNSSVIFLFQDSERFLWIGTFDGLNMYDGRDIHVYKPNISKNNTLSGNVIRKIVETENSYLWISTKWGLNKLSKKHNIIEEYYDEFKDDSRIVRDRHDNLYVIGKKGLLSVYDRQRKMFRDIPINPEIECQNITGCFIDANDTLYINHRGVMEKYAILHRDSSMSEIVRCEDYRHPLPIDNAFHDRDRILFVNRAGDLYIINQVRTFYAGNHAALFRENGLIASIIMHGSDILAGFKTNGLYCLRAQKNYEPEKIDINCGVFSLLKDEAQDIVWIGTDGQGVYAWTNDDYTFAGINLSQLPVRKERPVRAIYADSLDYLWMGTKDNGILRIKNHHAAMEYTGENVRHFTTATGLSNDAVFAFAKSRSGEVLWIGSDGPDINYYSYRDDRIHTLANHSPTGFDYIHSLFETSDSVLWAGAGSSLLKIALRKTPDGYEAASCRQYDFNLKNRQTFNQIFALHSENDSIIWIGIRGNGLVRFNALSGDYRLITFDENGIAPMNDILCIHRDRKNNFWIGSSYGITRLRMNGDGTFDCKNYNENSGLPNNTVHGILENADGELWLSSNNGIILFNPVNETFRTFNQKTGLKVVEFCDNAYFYDSRTAECFFGGVDGIVRIKNDAKQIRRFIPEIHFTRLRIFNSEYNIRDFEKGREGDSRIELNHNQNSFAISFVALDYVYGENGKYSYNLENFSSVWMNTSSNEAQFTNIPPGSYTLNVKYDDGTMPGETPVSRIAVIIHPPWYVTLPMKTFYVALALGLLFLIRLFIKKQYEEKKRNMARTLDEKYREELQERKLRFFTNITHEFCTPLTLIYGPCMRILNHEGCDASVLRYAGIIRSNAIRLNGLIQEVIDFRRMETGHRICHIQSLDINEILSELTDSFNEPAEHNGINFQTRIEPDMIWNTDCGCFTKILNNLISNAFKYTPPKGDITVTIYRENETLYIKVYNTGKGISRENIPLIFNRYSVLDDIQENTVNGLSSRNGLGLAICHSMTELLQGKIDVESEVDKYVRFTVSLPLLQTDENKETVQSVAHPPLPLHNLTDMEDRNAGNGREPDVRVLVIDDNSELLWIVKDTLSDEYLVTTANNGETGLQMLKQSTPDLIITDIMMPGVDGISLTRQLKQNRHTMHIPLIILSAKNTAGEKVTGIESGADAYIPKPFDPSYLKAIVKHLIQNRKVMEEYYTTSASAYNFANGQLIEKEAKDFLQSAVEIIHENIDNHEFLPRDLADRMKVSLRNLYRRFNELNLSSPKDFIKEQRIRHAAKLLLTTTLTIQEIMYRSGFTNRSHFYREFAKRFDSLTPKEYRSNNKQKDDLILK